MSAAAFAAKGLIFDRASVGYGTRTVVAQAHFALENGEFLGIVGPNGAGKSTLLRAVTGDASVVSGDITVGGASVLRFTEQKRARMIGVVPQTLAAPAGFSARAFVEMGRHPYLSHLGSLGPHDRSAVDEAMTRTDTARLADCYADELSGGDFQRLVLAQALAQEPEVLLLDEPTSHLDLNHTLQVFDLVRALADEGMAVAGVFHDLNLAARYADRIVVVAKGRASVPAPPAEALTRDVIARVFGVRAVVRTDPVTGMLAITPLLREDDLRTRDTRERVGLVCGSGTGSALMRRLVHAGYRVEAGALSCGDIDQAVASALGVSHTKLAAFGDIDARTEESVRVTFRRSAAVIVSGMPVGRANLPNLRAAVSAGVPLVLVGAMDAERDFTGGEAENLWRQAVSSGAVQVTDDAAAYQALETILAK